MVSMLFHKLPITVAFWFQRPFCFSGVLFLSIYFHSFWDIIIVREGMQILIYAHYAQFLRPLSNEGFVSVPHLLCHRISVLNVISEESMIIALRSVVRRVRTPISRIRFERFTTESVLYYSSTAEVWINHQKITVNSFHFSKVWLQYMVLTDMNKINN